MTTPVGYLCIALHAHLPYIRHPEKYYTMEENWLYEAITETYIPLLTYFNNLIDDGIPFKITMSLSPTLCAMLNNELLRDRYVNHIDRLIELAGNEIRRTRHDRAVNRTAHAYLERFSLCKHAFEEKYERSLVAGFKKLQDAGVLEIVTCAATHGYLPNMRGNANAVRAQIEIAMQSYAGCFGQSPKGIWLPECGYYQGLETILDKCGIRYTFMESHGLLNADYPPASGVFAPVKFRNAHNVSAFARDAESSRSVWSADEGYPGDPHYREFYKDIGHDLDMRYIAPYIDPAGIRINTGIKYHRVTNRHDPVKQLYNRENALHRASVHASDFVYKREAQIKDLSASMDRPPIIVAPYDAELFGHWWYEGPEWLNFLIRKCAREQNTFRLTTPSEYLDRHPSSHICTPAFSSWGDGGYSHIWLNETNEWMYPHLHRLEDRMVECAGEYYHTSNALEARALNQMARELLLAQSSDWAFIMKTGTTVEYATRRFKEHVASFLNLHDQLKSHNLDESFIALLESHNDIFPEIDFRIYTR